MLPAIGKSVLEGESEEIPPAYRKLRERGPAAFARETGRTQYWELLEAERRSLRDPLTGMVKNDYVEHLPCAACGQDRPYACFIKDGFSYVRCRSCGTVYVNPQLIEEKVMLFWSRSRAAEAWAHVLLHPAQREFDEMKFERSLIQLGEAGLGGRRLLDFGCGVGLFVKAALERGFKAKGVEPGQYARKIAVTQFGLDVSPSLDEIAEEQFDVITAWEVLEHTKSPLHYLRNLREKIAPGGRIIIMVGGNAASLANRVMQGKSAAFDFARFWYFTPDSFRILLSRAGWSIISVEQLLDEVDVVASYLGYGDPYQPPEFAEEILSPRLLNTLRDAALTSGMGYKFQVTALPVP